MSLKAWALQTLLQSKPPEPMHVEDSSSCAASVFVLNLSYINCIENRCISIGVCPSFGWERATFVFSSWYRAVVLMYYKHNVITL